MVQTFCEIWIFVGIAFKWAKFCEVLFHSVRYGKYVDSGCMNTHDDLIFPILIRPTDAFFFLAHM